MSAITKYLAHPEPEVREAAASALGQLAEHLSLKDVQPTPAAHPILTQVKVGVYPTGEVPKIATNTLTYTANHF